MYKLKSEIIEQIQSFHKQVCELYRSLYEKTENEETGLLLNDLYLYERNREKYLEKHKEIAKAMNCWLLYPSNKISNQISECFKNIKTGSSLSVTDLIKIELYFDNCLIKLYKALSNEDALNGTMANIFYYMVKKTKQEEANHLAILVD